MIFDFLKKLGFVEKLNIELHEAEEPLANPNNWGKHETTRIGFGHSFSITPLHLDLTHVGSLKSLKKTIKQ